MSGYYKNKRYKKNNSTSVFMTVITTLLIFAVIGGAAAMLRNNEKGNEVEYKTVYLIPSDDWKADSSLYGAWCWSGNGLPAASFVLATDADKDGVYEFKINKEYSGLTFVDLKPDTDQLGVNWDNKRAQTDDLTVPEDDNVYYHQYANEWSTSSDMLFTVTSEEMYVYLDCADWTCTVKPVAYYFDKTGKSDAGFLEMTQCGSSQYLVLIPPGYTHVIFIEYDSNEAVGTWDNIINQTSDLIIPIGEANYFDVSTNEWYSPEVE